MDDVSAEVAGPRKSGPLSESELRWLHDKYERLASEEGQLTASRTSYFAAIGTVLVTGDYKFDQTPVDGQPADVSRLAELGAEGVLLLCGDSTNADHEGFSPSESVVGDRPCWARRLGARSACVSLDVRHAMISL